MAISPGEMRAGVVLEHVTCSEDAQSEVTTGSNTDSDDVTRIDDVTWSDDVILLGDVELVSETSSLGRDT